MSKRLRRPALGLDRPHHLGRSFACCRSSFRVDRAAPAQRNHRTGSRSISRRSRPRPGPRSGPSGRSALFLQFDRRDLGQRFHLPDPRCPCAYALARYKFKGSADIGYYILSTKMMAPAAVVVPMFFLFGKLKLLDSVWALMLVYAAMNLSIVVWIIRSYMIDIPPRSRTPPAPMAPRTCASSGKSSSPCACPASSRRPSSQRSSP